VDDARLELVGQGQAPVDEFNELKWVTVPSGTRPFPF